MNSISEAKLSEREKAILTSTAEQSFVFDFTTDDHYKEAEVWVDKYEAGKFIGEVNHLSMEIKNSGTMIFTTSRMSQESDPATFTVSISSDGNIGTGWNPEMINKEEMSAIWGSNSSDAISIEEDIVLGYIGYARNEQESVSSLSTGFYGDMENRMDELGKFDIVYLLKCKFK